MKIELRELRNTGQKGMANYVSRLQERGKVKKYLSKDGYLMYDTEELETYKKTAKRGRPAKGVIYES